MARAPRNIRIGALLLQRLGGTAAIWSVSRRGIPGKRQIEVDSLGREKKIIAEQAPIAGDNIFLNIDAGLQAKIVEVLKQKAPNKAGAIVALEPKTGKVRAFVSWPTYDSNAFSEGIKTDKYNSLLNNSLQPLYNRVITGEYPSGSTIKIIMSAAGLEEGIINKNTSILSVGGVYYDKWFFPDWKAGGHGLTNVIKAIAESVNSFFYYLALDNFDGHHGLGLDNMLKHFKLFGLGSKLNIDLNGDFCQTLNGKRR